AGGRRGDEGRDRRRGPGNGRVRLARRAGPRARDPGPECRAAAAEPRPRPDLRVEEAARAPRCRPADARHPRGRDRPRRADRAAEGKGPRPRAGAAVRAEEVTAASGQLTVANCWALRSMTVTECPSRSTSGPARQMPTVDWPLAGSPSTPHLTRSSD